MIVYEQFHEGGSTLQRLIVKCYHIQPQMSEYLRLQCLQIRHPAGIHNKVLDKRQFTSHQSSSPNGKQNSKQQHATTSLA